MSMNRVTVVCERGAWHAGHKPRALAVFERESVPERMDCAGWRAVQVQGVDRDSLRAKAYPVVGISPIFLTDSEAVDSVRDLLWPATHDEDIDDLVDMPHHGLTGREIAEARLQTDMYYGRFLMPCEHVLGRQVFEGEEDRETFQPCKRLLAVCPCGWPSSVVTLCSIVDKLEEAARGTGVIHIEDIDEGGEETYVSNWDFTRQFNDWQRKRQTGSRAVEDKPYPATSLIITSEYDPFVIMCDGNSATGNYHRKHGAHVLAVIPMPAEEADTDQLREDYQQENVMIGGQWDLTLSALADARGVSGLNKTDLAFNVCPCCRTDLPAFTGLDLWDACKPLYDHGARYINVNTVLTMWQRMG